MRKDFKAHEFTKGDMVRYKHMDVSPTLGIVLGQDGMRVQVAWITWPDKYLKPGNSWTNTYNIERIEKDAE